MNYKKIYDQLIEHAQGSPRPQETSERHHIVPKCMGGSEEASNKVYLSTHEHIWAHIWLAQIYPDVFGLQLAVSFMVFGDNENLGRIPTEEQIKASVEARECHREQVSGEGNPMFGKATLKKPNGKCQNLIAAKRTPCVELLPGVTQTP